MIIGTIRQPFDYVDAALAVHDDLGNYLGCVIFQDENCRVYLRDGASYCIQDRLYDEIKSTIIEDVILGEIGFKYPSSLMI